VSTIRLTAAAAVLAIVTAAAATPAIDADRLLDHIKFLASDEMKGRADGSPEFERAGDYISSQFTDIGLKPGGVDGTWFQPFELIAGLTIGRENALVLSDRSHSVHLALGTSYYPLSAVPNDAPNIPSVQLPKVPVVFAGYGLSAPEVNYDDYAGLDVSGKAVLIFSHEPQEADPNSALNGNRPMPETTVYRKAEAAHNHGARLLIVVGDPTHRTDQGLYSQFATVPDADEAGLPVLRVRRSDVQPLLDDFALDAAARQIDSDLRPRSHELKGATLDYTEYLENDRKTVRNVVGTLPGSDPSRAGEAIVIGAHYDHVGLGGRLSMVPDQAGEIHNGADDNASGTASIIEIARAAAADRSRFPRTLIFVAFAGEERGLLGSAYYAQHPSVAPGRIAADINIDGGNIFGRTRDATLVSLGKSSLDQIAERLARLQGRKLLGDQYPDRGYYYRSDQFSFAKIGVPALFFNEGTDVIGKPAGWGKQQHDEWELKQYHQPSDKLEASWNLDGMIEDAKLDMFAGWLVAQADALPTWNPGDEFEAARKRALAELAVKKN
jgi:Zn-dependent M28 family amino/carboxypeptidase